MFREEVACLTVLWKEALLLVWVEDYVLGGGRDPGRGRRWPR